MGILLGMCLSWSSEVGCSTSLSRLFSSRVRILFSSTFSLWEEMRPETKDGPSDPGWLLCGFILSGLSSKSLFDPVGRCAVIWFGLMFWFDWLWVDSSM